MAIVMRSLTKKFPFKGMKFSEADIKREIRAYLGLRGIWHYNQWQGQFSEPGISDLHGLYLGIALYMEIKTSEGKLTQKQRKFLETANGNGGLGVVLRSVEDIIEICDGLKNGKDLSLLREKFSS